MAVFPEIVRSYINSQIVTNLSPAFLKVSAEGKLVERGGWLSVYGLGELQPEHLVAEWAGFLSGIFPLPQKTTVLECVQTDSGIFAEIHLFPVGEFNWVVLFDATRRWEDKTESSQQIAQYKLLQEKQDKAIYDYLLNEDSPHLAEELLELQNGCSQREVVILSVQLQGFTAATRTHEASSVINLLNEYMQLINHAVLGEYGLLINAFGESATAAFGLRASLEEATVHAIQAAAKMINAFTYFNISNHSQAKVGYAVSCSINTGRVNIGVVGYNEQKSLTASGEGLFAAACLQRLSERNEVLIDQKTYENSGHHREKFSNVTRATSNLCESKKLFAWKDSN